MRLSLLPCRNHLLSKKCQNLFSWIYFWSGFDLLRDWIIFSYRFTLPSSRESDGKILPFSWTENLLGRTFLLFTTPLAIQNTQRSLKVAIKMLKWKKKLKTFFSTGWPRPDIEIIFEEHAEEHAVAKTIDGDFWLRWKSCQKNFLNWQLFQKPFLPLMVHSR